MARVLITGGAGFIGCRLAAALLSRGDEVTVFDNLHPQVHSDRGRPKDLPDEVRCITGDVTYRDNWRTLLHLSEPEVVYHLAAETGTGQSLTEANRHAQVNVGGTAWLMDSLHAAKLVPRKIVLTSSRAVYGDGAWRAADGSVFYPMGRTRAALEKQQWDHLDGEGRKAVALPHRAGVTEPRPINVYGATKLTQEHMLRVWCDAFGSSLSVLRLQNVYGAGQALGNPYTGVLTFFSRAAVAKQVIDVYEDGAILRDFVHVSDVVAALVSASSVQTSVDDDTFDIGSGEAATIAQVAQEMAQLAGAPAPAVSGKYRHGDVRAASCDISAARARLGYSPKMDRRAGLSQLLDNARASL